MARLSRSSPRQRRACTCTSGRDGKQLTNAHFRSSEALGSSAGGGGVGPAGDVRNVLAHGPFGGLTGSADRSRRSGRAEGGRSSPLMREMRMAGMLEAAAVVSMVQRRAPGS